MLAREQEARTEGPEARSFVELSDYEARVVHLLAEGLDPPSIAEELQTTPAAIRRAVASLSDRLKTAGHGV